MCSAPADASPALDDAAGPAVWTPSVCGRRELVDSGCSSHQDRVSCDCVSSQ